jgi:hypothetical protein
VELSGSKSVRLADLPKKTHDRAALAAALKAKQYVCEPCGKQVGSTSQRVYFYASEVRASADRDERLVTPAT